MNIISLGAGVQSSAMALMASEGIINPMPDCGVFADTGDESKATYLWIDELEKKLKFPLHKVTIGCKLSEKSLVVRTSKNGKNYTQSSIPAFIKAPNGDIGILKRQCTSDFKLDAIHRFVRKMIGRKRSAHCNMLIGISLDEIIRIKPSQKNYITNTYPLIKMNYTRRDCVEWLTKNGYLEPSKSACIFCPYHNDNEWTLLQTNHPEEFARAVEYEKKLQISMSQVVNFHGTPYLHRSCLPLSEVVFQPFTDKQRSVQLNLFNNECEGMCGV